MRFGFDSSGGFAVCQRKPKLSAYAYPTSESATKARKNPRAVAEDMLAREKDWTIPKHIRDDHFKNVGSKKLTAKPPARKRK